MKKIILLILLVITSINISSAKYLIWSDETKEIYTQDKNDVVDDSDLDDPLRAGTRSAVENVEGIIDEDVSDSDKAQGSVIKYISKWINYFLALLALITIIFIIKDGIIIITAAGDDNKQKEAFKNVKNYIIALIGIGVSFLIINLIFHFVNFNTIV